MRKRKKISMAVLLLLLAAAPVLRAETVDFKDGLLTVQARNLPLKQILQQLADQTGAEITVEGTADNAVSADFAGTDLAAALLRIAPDFNSVVLYGEAGQQDKALVRAIRLYAISAGAKKSDVITFSPRSSGR